MFREPDEVAAEEAAAKLDKLAATGRSSIRRESTIRPQRTSSRALIDRIRERNTSTNHAGLRQIQELDADLAHYRRLRQQRDRSRDLDWRAVVGVDNDYLRPEPEPRSDIDAELLSRLRADPGSAALDELSPDFSIDGLLSDGTESISQHLPRPSRESGLRFEVGATSSSESEQPRARRTLATTTARRSSPPGPRRARWSRGSAINPEDEVNENNYYPPTDYRRPDRLPLDGPVASPPPESLEASYPPLRRVNHFSPRPMSGSGSRVDGLGDRMRSPSPTHDEPIEENWANLLNTMEPGRSSTATSFLSSRSDSRNGSNRSSQATTMTTSFGEIGGDDTCDLDLPSGITEDDVRAIRARHGRLREPVSHASRQIPEGLVPGDGQARARASRQIPDDSISGRSRASGQTPGDMSRGGSLASRERPDDLVQEALQRYASRGNEIVLELEVFGVILERMQRREEIPDEWWAAVGLSPDVVRGSA